MKREPDGGEIFYRVGQPPGLSEKNRKRPRRLVVLLVAVAVVVASGGGIVLWLALNKVPLADAVQGITESPLETAKRKCAPGSIYATVGDRGKTLILKSQGKEQAGMTFSELECFWTELEVSDAVRSEIGATRALDGRRSGDWGSFHASWSYHPDSGVNMTITMT